jgi:probable HAF family extracellular repeat protein
MQLTMTKLLSLSACLIFAFTTAADARVHAFSWDSTTGMTDLGSLGGDSLALGINDSGQIVGYSYLPDNHYHVVTWTTTGGIVDLGSIDDKGYSAGYAINSAGNIVGTGIDANSRYVAFFWSASTGYVSLGEIPPNGYADGRDINDSDTITGSAYGLSQGFIWRPSFSRFKYIGTLPGGSTSEGIAINNLGHVTGTATLSTGEGHAFIWTKTDGMRDIGIVREGGTTVGFGINDNDEVVGFTNGVEKPFYWRGSTGMRPLRTLGGLQTEVYAINNSGVIVGSSQTPANNFHAAFWSRPAASPQDLGTLPGGTVSVAKAVNASGQVVGWADIP